MLRRIITIDEELCNGCGICTDACHEGALVLVDGKARLLRDDYCDGLGDCLPSCPMGAISFEEREAAAYDEAAVVARQQQLKEEQASEGETLACGCPGTHARALDVEESCCSSMPADNKQSAPSKLAQWPVQIKLVPTGAPYYEGKPLLIAADCTAFAYASFHEDFMQGHITLMGCPKLDNIDYSQKLAEIIAQNNITAVKVARMEVPCCGGLEVAVKQALAASKKDIPLEVVTISAGGKILN